MVASLVIDLEHILGQAVLGLFNCSQDDTFDHSLVCLENPVKKPRKVEDRQEVTEYLKALHRVRLELTGVGLINL